MFAKMFPGFVCRCTVASFDELGSASFGYLMTGQRWQNGMRLGMRGEIRAKGTRQKSSDQDRIQRFRHVTGIMTTTRIETVF